MLLCHKPSIWTPTKRKQRKEEWKPKKKGFAYDFLIYLAIISKMLLLQSDSKLLDWSILSNPNNIWLMIHVWKNTASPFFLDEMVKMHWRAEQRACLTICFKFNCSVLWHKDWETQHILDSYVCPFGFVAQRPTRVAENIRVRQKRDIRRLWLKLWPIKPRCPTDPLLSPSLRGHLKPSLL